MRVFLAGLGLHSAANIDCVRPGGANRVAHVLRRDAAGQENPGVPVFLWDEAPVECLAGSAPVMRVEAVQQERLRVLESRQLRGPERFSHANGLHHRKYAAEPCNPRGGLVTVKLQVDEAYRGAMSKIVSSLSFTNTPTAEISFGKRCTMRRAFAGVM